ncbi:hypothetical protein CW713_12225 [Methanophagales archaeon]|nr:MAG: hypothetical protein CW714_03715 [Methanophagales archaeon]RJS75406.1 MAG: hypothetical protein CW713_12225 [Methanophagales archaeon]
MELNEILDEIIINEVYKGVKIVSKLFYDMSELTEDTIEKIKTDKDFRMRYKEELSKQLQKQGYEDLEVIDIDPSSNCLVVRYTAYYAGRREYPEIHLKTLLIFYKGMGKDIRDPDVFDEVVEKARQDLGEIEKDIEERFYHFATLFKRAIDKELVI